MSENNGNNIEDIILEIDMDDEVSARTAEAYAIGKRGGVDVGVDDPAYHNNAKYYAEQAWDDAGTAEASAAAAETAQGKAEDAQAAAENAQDKAEDAQAAAETAQGKAEDAQAAAETAQTAAETAQGKAEDAQSAAETAQGKAETAQGKAEDAQTAAETAQGKAEDAQTAAETAQTAAETAQGKAEDAQEAAETAQGKAEDAQEAAEDVLESIPADYTTLSDDVQDLKSAFENNAKYNSENILAIFGTHTDGTADGVTRTWLDLETCKLNNTATGHSNINIIYSTSSLPAYIEAGKTYAIKISRTNTAVFLRTQTYINGVATTKDFSADGTLTIPANCTGFVAMLRFVSGSSFSNDTITAKMMTAPSNESLFSDLETLKTTATGIRTDLNTLTADETIVKNQIPYNSFDIQAFYGSHINATAYQGMDITWNDQKNVVTIDGTATDNYNNVIINSTSSLPSYLEAGKTYKLKVSVSKSGLSVNALFKGSPDTTASWTQDGELTIPSGCTGILFYVRVVSGTVCSNDTVSLALMSAPTNDDLEAEIQAGIGIQITNNYTNNVYENSYEITASPTITTDTNQYLAAGSGDRTADIMAMLAATGVCRLGPGDFQITGITLGTASDWEKGQMLIGSGKQTRLILLDSVTDGYAVNMKSGTVLKDLQIRGGSTVTVSSTVGTRHGILISGNADGDNDSIPDRIVIDDVYISRLNGGAITARNTGSAVPSAILASNIHIWDCDAGINISYFSEFNQFVNVTAKGCYYGCVDNGGNNIFSNCNFSGNKLGLLLDNSSSQSPNNSHGGFANCIFDHSDSNNGTGIKILNCNNGEAFTGCQVFYSKIEIDRSSGMMFGNFNFGNAETIIISGGGAITFNHCMFGTAPTITITNNTHVVFDECYTRAGVAVTAT